jgi:ADP-ribose pyrophosphatase YjhB (NUDIX family)
MEADDDAARRIEANLYKLVSVLYVEDITHSEAVVREMALVKVRADPRSRPEILQLCEVFRARVVDVAPEALHDLGEFRVETPHGRFRYHAFVAPTELGNGDVDCREGRQIVFVDPASVRELPLVHSTELVLETLETWAADHTPTPPADARGFAGVILVDRRGWILLQERDEHPRIDPDCWGLSGGHLEGDEQPLSGALRELAEETGVHLDPEELHEVGAFANDHRASHGTWDRMWVYAAAVNLTDDDIDCREGRQIVFVDPDTTADLRVTKGAEAIIPAFLRSDVYATMAP